MKCILVNDGIYRKTSMHVMFYSVPDAIHTASFARSRVYNHSRYIHTVGLAS